MTKRLKTIIVTIAALSVALLPSVALPSLAAAADISSGLCQGSNLNLSDAACTPTDNTQNLQTLLTTAINYFSVIVGVIAVIMIIVGGLRYITSGGESGKVSGAKTTIIYALIGLVVVALAQLIVHFVLSQANNIVGGQ
ncbi:MAG TPA: pilin [Candidatus Saccharimonadales bacterium]|nr:pilin [Candidatus Saccharimonadales bacterium]